MDVLTDACSGEHTRAPARSSADPTNACGGSKHCENSSNIKGTQLNFDAEGSESIENTPSAANVQVFDSPSKASALSQRPAKGRPSAAQTIGQRSRTSSARTQASAIPTHKSMGTDVYIRVSGQDGWLKVVTNCHISYHGNFARTMSQLECHMQRAPEDPKVQVKTASFFIDGKWVFVDSQESYDEIHEAICAQPRMKCRVESAELADSDPRIPRLTSGTPQRSASASRSRPKRDDEADATTTTSQAAAAGASADADAQRRPTMCDCFVDSFDGTSQRRELGIDYGQGAEKVREQLVAAFGSVKSAEVLVDGAWVQVADVESFEAHRTALLAQEQVHWRLLVPRQEHPRPTSASASSAASRRESPLRGRSLSRTPSSPLRSRVSTVQERAPSRGKLVRPATPPRADRGSSVERLLRTPTSSRHTRADDAPQTPTSFRRPRVAAVAATNVARASPCRPLAIPRLKDDEPTPRSLNSAVTDDSVPGESSSAVTAQEQGCADSAPPATRSPAPHERSALDKLTPTVENAPDWVTSLRANSKFRKSKANGRRSISTGRAGARRQNKNLSSVQSVASLGLEMSNAQAQGLSETELFAFLQQMMGDTREEISWKLQAYREGGGFMQAEQEYQAAENEYIRLLYEVDSTRSLLNFLDGHDVQRALRELSKLHDTFKADPNSADVRASAVKQMTRLQSVVSRASDSPPDLCADIISRIKDIPTCEPTTACRKAHLLVDGAYIANGIDQLRKHIASLEQQVQATANSLETWDKRMKAAPDYQSVMRKREQDWMAQERSANEKALESMRSFIPVDVHQWSYAELEQQVRERNGLYPQELLRELKDNKLLHWVVMHPDDIKCANFLAGATAKYFTDLRQYDIVELRAVLAVLPETFELDRDGAKARWRTELLQLVKDKIARARQQVVPGAWNPVTKKRDQVTLPPLSEREMRRACYFYPTLAQMNAKLSDLAERRQKLEQKKERIRELEQQESSLRSEYSALVEDLRNKSLPPDLRQALSNAKAELKDKQDHTRRQVRKLSGEVKATEADLAANPMDENQLQQELELLRQRIPESDSVQTAVSVVGVFEGSPVIKKIERSSVSKYCPEEEARQRKKELEEARSQRTTTAVPNCENVATEANAPLAPLSPYVAGPRKSIMESASPLVVAKLNAIFGQIAQPQQNGKAEAEVPSASAQAPTAPGPLPAIPVTPKSKTLQRLLEAGSQPPQPSSDDQPAKPPAAGPMSSLLAELTAKRAGKAMPPPAAPVSVAAPVQAKPPMGNLFAELAARRQKVE